MIIAVAGPYSAPTSEQRAQNLQRLNTVAAQVWARGHIPVIGINAALPVLAEATDEWQDPYEASMAISLAAISGCEALLLVAESPGALRERDVFLQRGLPVYRHLDELPVGRPHEAD